MLVAQLQADLDYTFFSAHTREHGLGWIDPAQWRATATLAGTGRAGGQLR